MLVLDAGDLLFKKYSAPIPQNGSEAIVQKAYLIIDSLNLMGYDAMAIGDDDLSLGKEFLAKASKRARFPFISSNVIEEASGQPLFQRYILKEAHGLKIGIFSLLSPDVFLDPSDLRRKGVIIRSPAEIARDMVNELGPKTDMIILLSHLGYPKDVELAQTVSGIHIIIGGHTGVNLTKPPVLKNTVILQTSSKGMYGARVDLSILNREAGFYNMATKHSMERQHMNYQNRLRGTNLPETAKEELRRSIESIRQSLQQFEGKNSFHHSIVTLSEEIKDLPEIKKQVETYKTNFPEKEATSPPMEGRH